MLSVSSVKSASGAANYFAKDDYYTAEHASEATAWGGLGSADLGLGGEVSKEAFEKILNGELPSGEKVGQVQNRQSGIDLTFSMPKSASVLAYVAGDKRILAAHMQAVRATMAWAEASFAEGRTYDRTRSGEPVRTGNLVYAMFQHDTSRALDPQGHIHVLVANMTKMANGAWQALHNGELWRNNATIGAAYHAQFRAALAAIGYETNITGKYGQFEVNGVPRAVIEAFSQRRSDIVAKAAELGIKSPQGMDRITTNTRDPKLNVEDRAALREGWRETATSLGFDGKALVAAAVLRSHAAHQASRSHPLDRARETIAEIATALGNLFAPKDPLLSSGIERLRLSAVDLRAQHAVASAIRIHAQREAAFSISEVGRTALNLGLRDVTAVDIDMRLSDLLRAEKLIAGKNDRIDAVVTHVTTPAALRTEREILAEIDRGKGSAASIVAPDIVVSRLQAASGDTALNAGQLAAATLILTSADRIVAVQGVSGAGKSTMLSSVARNAEQEGRTVIGLALMKATADRLGAEAGIETRTVSSFIHSFARHALAGRGAGYDGARAELAGTVIVLDEASMVGSDQMKHLVGIANALGVDRLALVGDRQQITAVDAGKAFAIAQEGGIGMARMDQNLRQRTDQLRTVAALTNRGAVREAMQVLGDKVVANPEHVKAAADHWLSLNADERSKTAMFSSGRVARAELNGRIQAGLAAEGSLSGEGIAVGVLDKINLTREEMRYAHSYRAGQVIDLRYAMRELGLPRGTHSVIGIDARGRVEVMVGNRRYVFDPQRIDPLDKTDAMLLAEREQIRLRDGDRIRWTQNDKDRGVNNNDVARVLRANHDGIKVEGADGRIHDLKPGDPMIERISLAYALNMHAAQGITADTAIAVMSHRESNLSNQRLFNVTVTRVRDDIRLFTDDREKLTAAIERNEGNKTSALETLGELIVDPGRRKTIEGATKGDGGAPFNPALPAELQFGAPTLGSAAAMPTGAADPDAAKRVRDDPSLDLTSIRVGVEPKAPALPFPEKDIGLEL